MMSIVIRSILFGCLAASLLAGCASRHAQAGPATQLVVENQSLSDMRIYAIATGQRVRLGNVGGYRTETLRIPPAIIGGGRELSFEADPIAGLQAASSFSIYVVPGDTVRITIPPRVR